VNLNAVSIGKNPPHDVNVVIEVPIDGEPIKYEMDKESGALQVDRFLYTSMAAREITASSPIRCPTTATRAT
jgi:inorganic pyrophosphatase